MDYHVFKSMLNRYFYRHAGGENRPVYFNIDDTLPSLNLITRHFSRIRDEYLTAKEHCYLPQYHEIDPGEANIATKTDHQWNVLMLHLMGKQPEGIANFCPFTLSLLSRIPNLMQAFFSIMQPKKSVPLHEGPYLGYLRYHLGIQTPQNNAPYITVNGQAHTWRDGQAILFDDTWPHAVINDSDEPRAILIIDVLRPMPRLPSLVNQLCTQVIAKHTYGRSVMKRIKQFSVANAVQHLSQTNTEKVD